MQISASGNGSIVIPPWPAPFQVDRRRGDEDRHRLDNGLSLSWWLQPGRLGGVAGYLYLSIYFKAWHQSRELSELMKTYLDLLRRVMDTGVRKQDRTGTGTLSLFGAQLRFDLRQGFPLVTTKKLHWWSILHELLWFLRGDTDLRYLHEHGVTIWDEWADENGELGPIYGKQWAAWETGDGRRINQLANAIDLLRRDPDSRRIVVSAWNVGELARMRLLPCHVLFQFYVANGELSCQLYQRSADLFLGVPFNIASYALLTHLVAQQTDLQVGEFIWTGGDCHLYLNHLEQARLQLSREPYPSPRLAIRRCPESLFDYRYEDFEVIGYQAHPAIKAPVAV